MMRLVGHLEGRVDGLEKQNSHLRASISDLRASIDHRLTDMETSLQDIKDLLQQGKGAKKAIQILVAIVAGVAATISWFFGFYK